VAVWRGRVGGRVAVHRGGKDMNKFKPDGWPTVTPRIFTDDVARLVEFLKIVFGASGMLQSGAPTELRIGDSVVLISDGGGVREARPAFLYVYVEDADEAYRRAIAAGAESIERPGDMPYGDRRATVRDKWGNVWQIATYRGR
jgi:PhnB protein